MSILGANNPAVAAWEAQLAEQVRAGDTHLITGAGSSRIGLATGVALKAPDQAWDYDASALTLTTSAGVPVDVIQSILAKEGQRLGFEPPNLAPMLGRDCAGTIGGLVATNASGPSRVTVGACRDFCLGVGFVDGQGRVIKNGGRVMKNVTGLDLVKLMAGSHGTLGLITEVSLKTQPIPEMIVTLVVEGLSEGEAVAAMSAALGTPYSVTGAAHLRADKNGAPARTLIRIEGFEHSVTYRTKALQNALAGFGASDVIWDAGENATLWASIRDVARFQDAMGDVWRLSVKPSDAPKLVEAVLPEDVIYDWGGGRLWLLTKPDTDVRAYMKAGHATLVRASDATKQALGVFQPENAVVTKISAGLRGKFDPMQKFNRGMMS
ncbi:FAD-binding protein [Pacificibacter marinus]|uniref:FAD-binding protein n=1 Tax=Pacificibacter marinus TaxID=658057 RepID=UPI001C06AF47|nr:FAD-binding protein [Pacificibacter marinus]MBU2865952.1 FAD-binding protein [Pacificibacter marinus]